jgi:hypothetical protein
VGSVRGVVRAEVCAKALHVLTEMRSRSIASFGHGQRPHRLSREWRAPH